MGDFHPTESLQSRWTKRVVAYWWESQADTVWLYNVWLSVSFGPSMACRLLMSACVCLCVCVCLRVCVCLHICVPVYAQYCLSWYYRILSVCLPACLCTGNTFLSMHWEHSYMRTENTLIFTHSKHASIFGQNHAQIGVCFHCVNMSLFVYCNA